jgi:hypothetical protein
MHPQHQYNHNNPQLEIAIQQLVEAHTGIMWVLTQIVASTNNSLPQEDHGGKPTKVDVEMTRQAKGRTTQELTAYDRVYAKP